MHYFMIEAAATTELMEEEGLGGAYVNCWINFSLQDGAEVLARYYIEQDGWLPRETHEHRWAEQKDYQDNPDDLQYYLEAESEGVCFVFNTWPLDEEDTAIEP